MFAGQLKQGISGAGFAVLMAFAAGCGQNVSTAPVGEFTGRPIALPASERVELASLSNGGPLGVTVVVSAANGGVVEYGRYRLDFPPGALAQDTPISITQVDPATMSLELQPHGIQFRKPVRLSARVDGLVSSAARHMGVAWFNESTGQWEAISQDAAGGAVAEGYLEHFSLYDIFQD
jgi:hypothetical protein